MAGAGVLFLSPKGRRVLLLQRARNVPNPRQWNIPGGRVDPGETPVQAGFREAREELGMPIPPGIYLGHFHFRRLQTKGPRGRDFTVGVVQAVEKFKPKLNDESCNWGWFTFEEARKLDLHGMTALILPWWVARGDVVRNRFRAEPTSAR